MQYVFEQKRDFNKSEFDDIRRKAATVIQWSNQNDVRCLLYICRSLQQYPNHPEVPEGLLVPLYVLRATLETQEEAVLFKLTWGDHFIHTVVEDGKE